jgi:hypothetical protein
MKVFRTTLHFFNLLSLDVVLGAVAGMYFFSDILESKSPLLSYFLLGMAVWGIYTLDHLVDAKMTNKQATSPRHKFHQQNFHLISLAWVLVVLTGFSFLFLFPEIHFVIIPGILLALIMTSLMACLRWIGEKASWLKEISTAVFYVSGITMVPWLLKNPDFNTEIFYLLVSAYLMLAFLNLLILSYMDQRVDERDGFGSILVILTKSQLSHLIWFLGIFGVVFLVVIFFWQPSYFKIHISMVLLMFLSHLIQFGSNPKNVEVARQKMEAVFILPLILLLI